MLDPSSPTRPDSVRVLNRVPMGSRGCPTQPSMLVMEVWPLWSNSERQADKDTVNTECRQRDAVGAMSKPCTLEHIFIYIIYFKILQWPSQNTTEKENYKTTCSGIINSS